MKVLVTGYEGYIESVLVGMLTAHGHEVTGLDTAYLGFDDLPPWQEAIERYVAEARARFS
jgi:nucleoside-diphosphate-sugar epimerase